MAQLLSKRNILIIAIFLIIIVGGLVLLIDSPVGASFIEGFEDGYNGREMKS